MGGKVSGSGRIVGAGIAVARHAGDSFGPGLAAVDAARSIALEAVHPEFEGRPVIALHAPIEPRVPFVFNSPHSGDDYPGAFQRLSRLDGAMLRRSEDVGVQALFGGVVPLGAPLLEARFPRAWLDVNREPYELDPRMFTGVVPSYANVRSVRVAGGLGTIPRLVAEGRDIYRSRIPITAALERVERVYKPYHATLRTLLDGVHAAFGRAILVDCHSMPSAAGESAQRPDIVVGDRFGTACARTLSDLAVELLRDLGYRVSRNKPYAGGFITEHYGRPARGHHAIQIEINRGLYLDEATYTPTGGFTALADDLTRFADLLMARAEIVLDGPMRMAAE